MPTNKGHHAIKSYLNELQKIVSCVASEVCYVHSNNSGRQVLAWSGSDQSDPTTNAENKKQLQIVH